MRHLYPDDLACDCCGMTRAAPGLLLGAGIVLLPLALVAARMAYGICRDPLARSVAGLPW